MISSDNLEFLFVTIKKKFDDVAFWREIDYFLQSGVDFKLTTKQLVEAVIYLSAETVQYLIYNLSEKTLNQNEEDVLAIVAILKKRKLWPSLYRISLIKYQKLLPNILSTFLTELMYFDDWVNEKIHDHELSKEEIVELSQNSNVMSYLRVFWFLKVIVSWSVGQMIENFSQMEEIWIKTVEWLMDPSNIKVLMGVNANMYLEIYFDLFLNVDFNKSLTIGIQLKDRLTFIKNAMAGISVEPTTKEIEFHDHTTEEDSKGEEEIEVDNFITFKAIVESLLQFSDESKKVEISFLSLKLISMSVFKQILDDSAFVKDLLLGLLSSPFIPNRLWFNYEAISKEDFEEKVVRIIDQFQRSKAFDRECKRTLADLSVSNKFYRVYAFMVEITRGPIEAYRQYFSNLHGSNPAHLFMWIKRKIMETKNIDKKAELCFEIMKDLAELVRNCYKIQMDSKKAREIVMMIPNVGPEAVDSLG